MHPFDEIADDTARAVLGRLRAMTDYPPITITEADAFASLTATWELQLEGVDDFPRRFGARVKRAGGSYSECRGHQSTRFVHIGNNIAARLLVDELLAAAYHAPVVIARGSIAGPPFRAQRCSGIVQRGRSLAVIETRLRGVLANDVERGAVMLSWPDPRMVAR